MNDLRIDLFAAVRWNIGGKSQGKIYTHATFRNDWRGIGADFSKGRIQLSWRVLAQKWPPIPEHNVLMERHFKKG